MKTRKKFIIPFSIVLVILLVLCGTVFAYMLRQTEPLSNQFTPANVSCEVVERFDGTQKTSIQVRNTGNIDAYIRVRLVSYWVDSGGNIAPKPSVMPEISITDEWIKGSNDTYYYKTPVSPDTNTGELLAANITLATEDGYNQVIEVFAEAIQSKPSNAVTGSWGVTLDSEGNVASAP